MLELYRTIVDGGADVGRGVGLWGKIGLVVGVTVVSTAAGAALLVWIPADHFTKAPARTSWWFRHPVMRWVTYGAKNVLGLLILAVGLVMLVGPGPGLVFTLLGVSLLDVPGKREVERRIIGRPVVLRVINNLRSSFGKPPIIVDHVVHIDQT